MCEKNKEFIRRRHPIDFRERNSWKCFLIVLIVVFSRFLEILDVQNKDSHSPIRYGKHITHKRICGHVISKNMKLSTILKIFFRLKLSNQIFCVIPKRFSHKNQARKLRNQLSEEILIIKCFRF